MLKCRYLGYEFTFNLKKEMPNFERKLEFLEEQLFENIDSHAIKILQKSYGHMTKSSLNTKLSLNAI